jgi:SAM-dependent methyltransferase
MRHEADFFPKGTRILYIAPMHGIRRYLMSLPGTTYLGADLESSLAEAHFDLQDIPYPANSFDFCICSHTIAHIPDDLQALSELHRVLSPDGRLLVLERIYDRPQTYQHPQALSAAERLQHYEQADRWRIYGHDFAERLSSTGFKVSIEYPAGDWPSKQLTQEGIDPKEGIFIAMR